MDPQDEPLRELLQLTAGVDWANSKPDDSPRDSSRLQGLLSLTRRFLIRLPEMGRPTLNMGPPIHGLESWERRKRRKKFEHQHPSHSFSSLWTSRDNRFPLLEQHFSLTQWTVASDPEPSFLKLLLSGI